jgi:hypothetical protein
LFSAIKDIQTNLINYMIMLEIVRKLDLGSIKGKDLAAVLMILGGLSIGAEMVKYGLNVMYKG